MSVVINGAAAEFAARKFGGPINNTESLVSVGTSVVNVNGFSPDRVWLYMINVGAGVMYVSPFNTVSSSQGFILQPNGGFISLNVNDDFQLPTFNWFAVCSAPAGSLFVISGTRETKYTIDELQQLGGFVSAIR